MSTDLIETTTLHPPSNGLSVAGDSDLCIMPVYSYEDAHKRYGQMVGFIQKLMVHEKDYGVIPGTGDKPTLYKPGAEKLSSFFGFSPRFVIVEKIEDWTGADHGGEPFFYYWYKCQIYKGNRFVAEGDGSCNSWEKKYRYRQGERKCPSCGAAAIIKSKDEYGGGWVCFKKKGGCGTNFLANAIDITSQSAGAVPNPDIADQVNTLQKMGQKRSFIGGILIACNASEFFTQDIEDMTDVIDGSWRDADTTHPETIQSRVRVADAVQSVPAQRPATTQPDTHAKPLACEVCGGVMTPNQVKISANKFNGQYFCPPCQKTANTVGTGAVAAATQATPGQSLQAEARALVARLSEINYATFYDWIQQQWGVRDCMKLADNAASIVINEFAPGMQWHALLDVADPQEPKRQSSFAAQVATKTDWSAPSSNEEMSDPFADN